MPLRKEWRPQHSLHEPELEILAESRKRRLPKVHRPLLSPSQLEAAACAIETVEELAESPIERQFGIAAAAVFGAAGFRLVPQYEHARYRYDFAVLHPNLAQVLLFIECDGKQFHSNAQQIENDKKKDAAAEEINSFVIRYTGAAINRDPKDCAENALGWLRKAWRAV